MYLHLFSGLFLPLTKHPPRNLLWRIVYEFKKLLSFSLKKLQEVTNFRFSRDCFVHASWLQKQFFSQKLAKQNAAGDKFQIPTNWLQGTILEVRFCKKKSCWWQISNSNILTAGNNPWSQVLQKSLLVTNFKFQQIDCRCTLVDGNGRSVNKALWLIVDGWVIGPRCASTDRNAWNYKEECFFTDSSQYELVCWPAILEGSCVNFISIMSTIQGDSIASWRFHLWYILS